jgi:hypothetical protein
MERPRDPSRPSMPRRRRPPRRCGRRSGRPSCPRRTRCPRGSVTDATVRPSAIWRLPRCSRRIALRGVPIDPPDARKVILPLSCGANGWR